MQILLQIIFWFSVACLLHTYIIFPILLNWFARGKRQNQLVYKKNEELLSVSILLAVYNEEKVIESKILSTFNTNFPIDKIEFLIGSDASSDATDSIIEKYKTKYPQINLTRFKGRTGKAGIINELAKKAKNEILILTDANVFFKESTIYHLTKHYRNPAINLVGGNIINNKLSRDGISVQEKTYLDRENRIKYLEGVGWGCMIGAFGGCYSIRKEDYFPVPPLFFMDDFFITLNVLSKDGEAINELEAQCEEDVSNIISEEFRRKVRISIGNFQNLNYYRNLLWRWNGLSFCFWSHKVLRWMGPFFLILMMVISLLLTLLGFQFYEGLFYLQVLGITIPLIDSLIKKVGIHISLFRFISHFYLMNLALLIGFFRYINGVESNIWKPTERFQ